LPDAWASSKGAAQGEIAREVNYGDEASQGGLELLVEVDASGTREVDP